MAQIDSVSMNPVNLTVRGSFDDKTDTLKIFPDGSSSLNNLTYDSRLTVLPNSGTGLATISIRGGNTEQTSIRWNGIALQSGLNGSFDAQFLPPIGSHNLQVNGPQSVHRGGGGITGNIELSTDLHDTVSSFGVNYSYGLFQHYTSAQATYVDSSVRISGLVHYLDQDISFEYPSVLIPNTIDTLNHARAKGMNVMASIEKVFKCFNPLRINIWYSGFDRQIPPTMLENASEKFQWDEALRIHSSWRLNNEKQSIDFITGLVAEELIYHDSISNIYSDYKSLNGTGMVHYLHQLSNKLWFGADIETRTFRGLSPQQYDAFRIEQTEAIHIRYSLDSFYNTRIQAGLRAVQYSDNSDFPFLYGINIASQINHRWNSRISFSSNYRMPTFNQLFWVPGGNVNLSSERSESGEIVVSRRSAKSYTSLTLYGNQIRDAIRWLPGSNGIFTAQQVRGQTQNTSGIELSHRTDFKRAFINLGASYQRAFVSGTDTEIPLIPRLQGSLEAGYRFSKALSVYYRPRYWSTRFTDMNNVEELREIWLHGCGFEFDRTWLTISLMINNAANQFYTFLPYRPNTPRNFEFTISYKI